MQYENHAALKKTVAVALSWMARQLSWQNTTKQMGLSIMQTYHMQKGSTSHPIPWHGDASTHSLVILLDDEKNGKEEIFCLKQKKKKYAVFIQNKAKGFFFLMKIQDML